MIDRIQRYYSQNGEDCLLMEFFGYRTQGCFVDVGAFDGYHLSNSLAFEEAGWQGICIEPNRIYFDLCRQRRPGSVCIHAACVDTSDRESVILHTEKMGLLSSVQHSTENEADIRQRYEKRHLHFEGVEKVEVPALTLDKALERNKDLLADGIDFVSIDVEGFEVEVLRGFSIAKHQPRVILVESNSPRAAKALDDYLVDRNGYFFARTHVENRLYTRTEADARKLAAIEVNCVIEKQMHPLGLKYTPPSFLEGKIIAPEGTDLRKHVVDLRARIEALSDEAERRMERIADLKRKIEAQSTKLDRRTERIADLQGKLEAQNAQLDEHTERIGLLADSLKAEKEVRDDLERRLTSEHTALRESEKKTSALLSRNEALESDNQKLRQRVEAFEQSRVTQLVRFLDRLRGRAGQ